MINLIKFNKLNEYSMEQDKYSLISQGGIYLFFLVVHFSGDLKKKNQIMLLLLLEAG